MITEREPRIVLPLLREMGIDPNRVLATPLAYKTCELFVDHRLSTVEFYRVMQTFAHIDPTLKVSS